MPEKTHDSVLALLGALGLAAATTITPGCGNSVGNPAPTPDAGVDAPTDAPSDSGTDAVSDDAS